MFKRKQNLSGDLMLFDVCGETNITDAVVVLVAKRISKNKYRVLSIDTGKVFEANKKYLTPLKSNNINNTEIVIRYSNRLNLFNKADHLLISDIKNFLISMANENNANEIDSYLASLSLLDSKIIRHIQNTSEVDMINIIEQVNTEKVDLYIKAISKTKELQDYVNNTLPKLQDSDNDRAIEIIERMLDEMNNTLLNNTEDENDE